MAGTETSETRRRMGLFGDLPTRLLRHGMQVAPWFLELLLVPIWTLLFFSLAKSQRRGVMTNLRALHPEWSPWRTFTGAYQVFLNFAATHVDALRSETGTGSVDWIIDGVEHFRELAERRDGCIVLTAHMGNYDLAAPVFSGRFGRTLYAVRAPEREPEMQALREKELRDREAMHTDFRSLYNHGDGHLGVELANLLREANVVALQGDRVLFDVSPIEVEVEPGLIMRLPKGPLYLARATGAPCYPLFVTRDGWRRYRVTVFPELNLPPRQRGAADPAVVTWASALLKQIRNNWVQWHVFEPVFHRKEINPTESA